MLRIRVSEFGESMTYCEVVLDMSVPFSAFSVLR
jgi:hypothetical protein